MKHKKIELKNPNLPKLHTEQVPNVIVLTVDEVVAYTGYKKSYIYKLAHLRRIPHHKPMYGRKLFFSKAEIDEWLLANKLLTVSEIF